MPTLEDELNLQSLYCMFKGEPGTRKSTCALSFPRPQYWFSFDQKMNSILIPAKNWGIDLKEISFDDYKDWTSARVKLEALSVNCPFKTIVIDSITSVGDAILRQTLKQKSGVTRSSGQGAGKLIGGISVNEIEDFNAETSALSELIAITKDIHQYFKINIILIAHVIQVDYKSLTGATQTSRSIVTAAKKNAAKIPAYCDEVYHFNMGKSLDTSIGGTYELLTVHSGDEFARTSLPLPEKIAFGNDSLYDKYLVPAMTKLKSPK